MALTAGISVFFLTSRPFNKQATEQEAFSVYIDKFVRRVVH